MGYTAQPAKKKTHKTAEKILISEKNNGVMIYYIIFNIHLLPQSTRNELMWINLAKERI